MNVNYDLELYNAIGQRLDKKRLVNSKTISDWSDLPTGVYFLYIKTPYFSRTFKLVKQKH